MNGSISRDPGSPIAATVASLAKAQIFLAVLTTVCCFFPSGAFGQESDSVPQSGKNRSTSLIWAELLQKTPYPHTAPLPARVRTALDGTYAKFDPKKTPPVPCRRCPDYLPEGGVWKLNLDKGVFRIFHEITGWRSLGSFMVDGNQVRLFNDPYCPEVKGAYRWAIADGNLILQVIEDNCAIGLRAVSLMKMPWRSCPPLSMETDDNDHRPRPTGCD